MLVKKIYGSTGCYKCEKAKQKFPNAEYTDLMSLPKTEYEILLDKARLAAQSSLPILIGDKEEIILHFEAGI